MHTIPGCRIVRLLGDSMRSVDEPPAREAIFGAPYVPGLITLQDGSTKMPQLVSATNAACNSYSNATYFVSY